MATLVFSHVKGGAVAFNPLLDVFCFDYGRAADVNVTLSGTTVTLRLGSEWVSLLGMSHRELLTSGNVSFADGSLLLIGDDTTGTSVDASANDLRGGAGNDILNGGAGGDDLTGDLGADVFRFYLASESTPIDFGTIRDFSAEEGDRIDLSLIDANTVLAGNNEFIWSSAFTGSAGQFTVGTSAGSYLVQGDVNGDAIADLAFEVRLHSDMVPLAAADFLFRGVPARPTVTGWANPHASRRARTPRGRVPPAAGRARRWR